MYHTVIVAGHLGRDPEMRYTADGTPVASFSMAANRRWTGQDGTAQEETIWFRVSAWRRLAEFCNQYLQKGRAILVEGELRPDPNTGAPRLWTGNDGVARSSYELTARTIRFLGGRGEAAPVAAAGGSFEAPPADEDEIPF